jgi:hypothetical protein
MAKFDRRIDGLPLGATRTCRALASVSADFHTLIRSQCPRCHGNGPACLIETMRAVLTEETEPSAEPATET